MILTGKTVLFLGSSVTYGSAAGGISFADVMAEETGCIAIKEAVSGTTLADLDDTSYVSRLKKVDPATKVDLFICQLSTNDASRNIELHKVREAIRFILKYTKETFGCPVIFYTGTYYESAAYADMIHLLYTLKNEHDFHILDLYHDAGMLAVTPELYRTYMSDPIHPTLAGYRQWWAPKFIEYCQALNPVETAYFAGGCFWCITPTQRLLRRRREGSHLSGCKVPADRPPGSHPHRLSCRKSQFLRTVSNLSGRCRPLRS